jgi:hypothetical protein
MKKGGDRLNMKILLPLLLVAVLSVPTFVSAITTSGIEYTPIIAGHDVKVPGDQVIAGADMVTFRLQVFNGREQVSSVTFRLWIWTGTKYEEITKGDTAMSYERLTTSDLWSTEPFWWLSRPSWYCAVWTLNCVTEQGKETIVTYAYWYNQKGAETPPECPSGLPEGVNPGSTGPQLISWQDWIRYLMKGQLVLPGEPWMWAVIGIGLLVIIAWALKRR